MENKRILVIGGTGYIGEGIVDRLRTKGYAVTVLSRKPERHAVKRGVRYIKGSVLDKGFLLENLKDFDVIIYLAAIVRVINKMKYKENIAGLSNTLETMRVNKINRIIYFSTQNVYIRKTGPYGNSKKMCEKIIYNSPLDYMIIRPNYVYGVDTYNDFYKLYNIIRKTRMCPIIGNGKTRIQPINKDDIADMTLKFMKEWRSREEINVSGKTDISLNQIVDMIKKQANLKFMSLNIPIWMLKLCKWAVPFDVDGYTEDRVSPQGAKTEKGNSDIEEDIKKIIKLNS